MSLVSNFPSLSVDLASMHPSHILHFHTQKTRPQLMEEKKTTKRQEEEAESEILQYIHRNKIIDRNPLCKRRRKKCAYPDDERKPRCFPPYSVSCTSSTTAVSENLIIYLETFSFSILKDFPSCANMTNRKFV